MAGEEIVYRSARELSELIGSGELSPVEVVAAFLARIEALDAKLNAFITVTADQALSRARQAEIELRKGRRRGPLHGVPYAPKDLFATRGIRTTNGSRLTADWVPDFESTATERLNRAGAVLIGKLNLNEFAIGSEALSLIGPARNPWHPEYSAEGSSGGSGAAVAAALTPLSIGTETGGSIRKPAAVNGIVGMKPTYGRISRFGASAVSWTLDHVGPMTRTVADAALMLQVLAGPDPLDASSSPEPVPDYAQALSGDIRGLRLGIPERFFYEDLGADVEEAVRAAISTLVDMGARPVEVTIPHAPLSVSAGWVVSMAEAASYHETRLRTAPGLFEPLVRERLRAASAFTATEYLKSQRIRTILKEETRKAFEQCDVMVMPTTTRIGKKRERPEDARSDVVPDAGEELTFAILSAVKTTIIGTMTGIPAITVPCGFSRGRPELPIGVQFYAKPFDELNVLRVAHAYESATDWHARRPPIA
jgi:aspartyl-tRNA(Asn)/glutamyl-tRNA(Gln) amidotransferase subunit A